MARVLDNNEFKTDVLEKKGPILVDFFATWCGPCKMLSPVLDKLAADYGDKLPIYKVDIDQCQNLARDYGVRGVPCMKVFENGEVQETIVGAQPEEVLKGKLSKYVA